MRFLDQFRDKKPPALEQYFQGAARLDSLRARMRSAAALMTRDAFMGHRKDILTRTANGEFFCWHKAGGNYFIMPPISGDMLVENLNVPASTMFSKSFSHTGEAGELNKLTTGEIGILKIIRDGGLVAVMIEQGVAFRYLNEQEERQRRLQHNVEYVEHAAIEAIQENKVVTFSFRPNGTFDVTIRPADKPEPGV